MVEAGIKTESAHYYESLHETPLIANNIARNHHSMNRDFWTRQNTVVIFGSSLQTLVGGFYKSVDTDWYKNFNEGKKASVDKKKNWF